TAATEQRLPPDRRRWATAHSSWAVWRIRGRRRRTTLGPTPTSGTRSGPLAVHSDLARARGSPRPCSALPGRVELTPPHGEHRAERTFVTDLGRDDAGERDGDDERPRRGEEAETDADLPLDAEHREEDRNADTPRHVPCPPREGGLRRAEPDRVDAVDLVVSSNAHRACPTSTRIREQACQPFADADTQSAHGATDDGESDNHAREPPHPARVVAPAATEPQQQQRDGEQHERNDVVQNPVTDVLRAEFALRQGRKRHRGHRVLPSARGVVRRAPMCAAPDLRHIPCPNNIMA